MNKHSFETFLGIATRVFEIKAFFTNKETKDVRVATDWCWAKTKEEAVAYAQMPYVQDRTDVVYLEDTSIRVQAVELVGEPNPSNIANMDKGKPFYFNRDKPGILRDKWGY